MKRILPFIVFVLVASLGIGMTMVVYRAELNSEQKRFEILADEAVDSLQERLRQHIALLFFDTRSFFRPQTVRLTAERSSDLSPGLVSTINIQACKALAMHALLKPAKRSKSN